MRAVTIKVKGKETTHVRGMLFFNPTKMIDVA
jgi:hypothetical protein